MIVLQTFKDSHRFCLFFAKGIFKDGSSTVVNDIISLKFTKNRKLYQSKFKCAGGNFISVFKYGYEDLVKKPLDNSQEVFLKRLDIF